MMILRKETVAQTRRSRSKLGGDVLSSRFVIRYSWRTITPIRFMIPIVVYGLMMSFHFRYGCYSQNERHLVSDLSASPSANSSPSGPKPIVIQNHASNDVRRVHCVKINIRFQRSFHGHAPDSLRSKVFHV